MTHTEPNHDLTSGLGATEPFYDTELNNGKADTAATINTNHNTTAHFGESYNQSIHLIPN